MFDFLNDMDMLGVFFWLCAIAGTLFFLLRVAMLCIGASFEGADGDAGGDVHDSTIHHDAMDYDDSSDASFQLFSVHSITAFIMMFGWAGLSSYIQFELGPTLAILIALAAGTMVLFITAYLFKLALKLVSPGAQFDIEKTVGLTAKVYQEISQNGAGRIQLSLPGAGLREIDAVSEDKKKIESFVSVKIVRVIDPSTVSVKRC